MKTAKSAFVAAAFALTLPALAEEHRELGPHEHGVGRLKIVIEDQRLSMDLDVPGADIVGFEHEASTPAQRTAVKKAKSTLEAALNVFKLPAEAKCEIAEALVEIEAGHHDHDKAGGKGEVKHEGDKQEEGDHHSDFHAAYSIDCASPEMVTGIDFKYFDLFAGARKLEIDLVTEKGQNHYEVSREQPRLRFGEIG
jgi:hypothetical protein